jgi:membrane-bound lytic murein transglycosylase F
LKKKANILKNLLLCLVLLSACSGKKLDKKDTHKPERKHVEVPFLEDGKLVALMSNNISSYYILKGQPRGFEYEMLKLFCKDNNLDLQVKVIQDFDYLLDSLVAGKGDIAAGNLTITKDRKARVDFTPEVLRTRQVLVQRLPDNYRKLSSKQRKARILNDALDLNGKTVHVNASSSFYGRLENYANENGIDLTIEKVSGDVGTDRLMRMVSEGDIDYTIADENMAKIHQDIYKNIDISVPISLSQSIAWAIPKGQNQLAALVEAWMEERKNSTRYNMIYNKYFGSKSQLRKKGNYLAIVEGQISPYDDLIKQYADNIEWDWLMLAALINKESTFNPSVESPFGAKGLMQVMPRTASQFGVDANYLFYPEANLQAGTRYLQWLDNYWLKILGDNDELQYFVLASYNAGQGHVLDAMRLAEKNGLDPHVWFDNVELMMLKKSEPAYYRDPVVKHGYVNGIQPVQYVTRILSYYSFYKAFQSGVTTETGLAVSAK